VALHSSFNGVDHQQPLSLVEGDHYSNPAQLEARTRYQKLREKQLNNDKRRKLREERYSEIRSQRQQTAVACCQYWREMETRAHENRAIRVNNVSMVGCGHAHLYIYTLSVQIIIIVYSSRMTF